MALSVVLGGAEANFTHSTMDLRHNNNLKYT